MSDVDDKVSANPSQYPRPLPSERNLQIRASNATTVGHSKELRRNETAAEKLLWDCVRNRRLGGLKFRRQCSLGGFIVDFLCADAMLAVELDGDHHLEAERREYDDQRTDFLRSDGYLVLRFRNTEITEDIDRVCKTICETGHSRSRHTPLSREGEGPGVREKSPSSILQSTDQPAWGLTAAAYEGNME